MQCQETLEKMVPGWEQGVSQLLPLLRHRHEHQSRNDNHARENLGRSDRGYRLHLCSELDVYSTSDDGLGWDCGYRNLQMMISALTPLVRTRDSAGSLPPTTLPASAPWRSGKVPSVLLIQRALEEAWSCGFDPESSHHFHGTIQGSRAWIGAIDAAALLRFWGIEARLVDSDPRQSAQRWGPHPAILAWIWDYFEKRCVRASGCVACRIDAATEPASRGDTEVERATTMTGKGRQPIPPLFLQYAGHSMTVIGAELNTALEEVQLVILDPNRQRHAARLHLDLRSLWDLQAPQYQVLYIAESIFWDERTPIAYRQTLTSSRLT